MNATKRERADWSREERALAAQLSRELTAAESDQLSNLSPSFRLSGLRNMVEGEKLFAEIRGRQPSFHAQWSNTAGEMWVSAGQYDSWREAEAALAGFARAGNPTRIVRINGDASLGTVAQLIERGEAVIES